MSQIPTLLDNDINESICEIPRMEELKEVVFNFKKEASASPIGFIKFDLLKVVEDFFRAEIPCGISATYIALIPKVEMPTKWSDFRPISLCNFSHKILSKLLNERLAMILAGLISENQSGFLKGRLILDSILLTQEMVFAIDVKTRGSNIVMKIGMQKAYDRLNWGFLCNMLADFGFDDLWIGMLMRTINSCHFGILLNGVSKGFIKSEHGLTQGDPLSPALFILACEYLSRGLNKLFEENPNLFFDTKKGYIVSHLAYADDLILFPKATKIGLKRFWLF